MNKLLTMVAGLGIVLNSGLALAGGTSAGTPIQNTATVTYSTTSGGSTRSVTATSNEIIVQELILSTLTSLDSGDVAVTTPETEAEMKFRLTNNGNGNEAFILNTSQPTSGDDFDATLTNIYIDDGDGVLNTSLDSVYDANNPPVIAPDDDIVFWVTGNIPGGLADGDEAAILLSALSKTFADANQNNPTIGAVVSGGDSGTEAISGENLEQISNKFIVSDLNVQITKTSSINDGLGSGTGTQPIPGAEVDYTITVSVTGSGTAYGVEIVDPLPSQLRLKDYTDPSGGIIMVNGNPTTGSASNSDGVEYNVTTNEITVNVGDIDAGDPDTVITFTSIIQ
ncbi:DUF11 domain-containing protein [Bermanella marisrubri]|uniref:DUF11 domain-containing protein n=1 Tax=Bermanella marisrubri TaxID=207949 RepID=Q1N145_9GAMM|nr:DUF11 domain-containing protein [Bermanella marisrubri]EAT12006.1 hypothetical protein RED65_11715 [Oceanobacter sp. RED65] [Bermanella marisrubri]QIZ84811.1 DUF11 domain-containing protein [Bermanella marisrubri]